MTSTTTNGFKIIVIEEKQRLGRGQWVLWHRAEIFDRKGLVTITRRVATRSLAQEDGERAAMELSSVLR